MSDLPRRRVVVAALLALGLLIGALTPAAAADGQPDDEAGRSSYRVVGGQPAAEGAWPTVIALVRAEDPDAVTGQLCGGTVIGPDLVLTAAHCFHDDAARDWRGPTEVRVVAGTSDLSAPGVQAHGTAVYLHPSYDPRRRRHDVAVLRVDADLGMPVQDLATAGQAGPFAEDRAVVLGWGRTGQGEEQASARTSRLQQATVPVSSDADCRAAYEGSLDLLAHLCAGGQGTPEAPAADACTGDSGGPLLVQDPSTRGWVQQGVTSFGPTPCGVGQPGVYARLSTVRPFIDEVVAGSAEPTALPEDGDPLVRRDPVRIAAEGPTTAIPQAVASSRAVFADGVAELAVLARADGFADALAGSSLAYGRGPLLFTDSTGSLDPRTRAELLRVLPPGAPVFLLGGTAAVPAVVADELASMGLEPRRLAGDTREATAAAVGAEVVARHGSGDRPPFGTAILVTSQAWPDAVVAGQLGVWWGYPIILTPPDALHPAAQAALTSMGLDRLLIVGGRSAVSSEVRATAESLLDGVAVTRLAGDSRITTALRVAEWQAAELARLGEPPSDTVAVVNLRAEGAYSHMLAATPLLGATAGVFLPVENEAGDLITPAVSASFCGLGGLPLVVGGTDLVADQAAEHAADLLAGINC